MILSRAISESNFTQSGYNEARLIQELCDMNTLRSALDKGIMQLRGEALPDPGLMLMLAHDIACGLQHIHSLNIIHGDLKALNVLLCSSTRKILGDRGALPKCVAKVSDFGMSEQLATEQTHQSNVHSGTITHMAPETIIAGHLSKASDVYAFGIILYEMFSGKRPYEGCNVHQIYLQVGQQGKRPIFPHGVPIKIVELACSCWGPAENRPTFEKIVVILQNMLNSYVPAVSRNYMASGQNHSAYNGAGGVDASTDDSLGIYKALQMQGSSRSVSNSMSGQSFRA